MITSDMQRQYQLLKESGAYMSLPNLFAGTPEYNDSDFNKVFQEARLTPQDIIALTGGDNAGVFAGELRGRAKAKPPCSRHHSVSAGRVGYAGVGDRKRLSGRHS